MTSGDRGQLLLDFPRIDADQRPLIEVGPYRSVVAALRRWREWPGKQLAVSGEAFSGRTRLLRWWAGETGAAVVSGAALARAPIDEISSFSFSALAVDDADAPAPKDTGGMGLLAALNLCRDRGLPVLLAGAGEPVSWQKAPPDLVSRLRAMPVAHLDAPDDESLSLRLREECARRHLILPDESVAYLTQRMERSWHAIGVVADQIERTKGRAETIPSARAVLVALGMDPG
jgi:chromosomal replication initiation ATPase DnaA